MRQDAEVYMDKIKPVILFFVGTNVRRSDLWRVKMKHEKLVVQFITNLLDEVRRGGRGKLWSKGDRHMIHMLKSFKSRRPISFS